MEVIIASQIYKDMKRIGLFIAIIVVSVHVSGQELWAYQAPTALSVLSEDVAWSMSVSDTVDNDYDLSEWKAGKLSRRRSRICRTFGWTLFTAGIAGGGICAFAHLISGESASSSTDAILIGGSAMAVAASVPLLVYAGSRDNKFHCTQSPYCKRHRRLKISGWTALGIGVPLTVGGAVFWAISGGLDYSPETWAKRGKIMVGVGAPCLLSSIPLLTYSGITRRRAMSVALGYQTLSTPICGNGYEACPAMGLQIRF